jgi:Protein of unknown function (DUF3795)
MSEIVVDQDLIAYCGLYCGACHKFIKAKCQGCHTATKAGWCKVRSCNIEHQYNSCADCKEFKDPKDCRKFNNFFSKLYSVVYRSDRAAGIRKIKIDGSRAYAAYMAAHHFHVIKRK